MCKPAILAAIISVCLFSGIVTAAPLSVNITDHDFTFHVPFHYDWDTNSVAGAVYDFNGAGPDVLRLTSSILPGELTAGTHNVASYGYTGLLPQVSAGPGYSNPPLASPWLYPTLFTTQFGAKLELEMHFDANDGPYTNPSGDVFDISLTGSAGFLRITGWIGSQGWPTGILYPDAQAGMPNDIVLFEIQFDKVTLLAREGHSTADLIEGVGQITMAMGYTAAELMQMPQFADFDLSGVTFFKFMLPDEDMSLFPASAAAPYDPLQDYPALGQVVFGAISGEAGVSGKPEIVPEPATFGLLLLGGLAGVGLRRRRA